MNTKACNLTETEVKELIRYHGLTLHNPKDEAVERIAYLNKRLEAFSDESEKPKQAAQNPAPAWPSN